jgi:TonB family protein
MRSVTVAFRYTLWMAISVRAATMPTPALGQSLFAQQSRFTPSPSSSSRSSALLSVTPSAIASVSPISLSDLANLETKVRPSVLWVTAFDQKGNLLRTESGFFISPDGRFVTTAHAIDGGINAVAKTADGGIYNVSGVLATSKASDLAVLKADVQEVPFLELDKNATISVGAEVVVVGSGLAGSEGSPRETTIAAKASDRLEIAGATAAPSVGAPVVSDNGEVIGVVTSAGEKTIARPIGALESVLSRVTAETQARWPQVAEISPSPHATPRPRLIYAPAPSFPPGQSLPGQSGTGRFRLNFDAEGNVTNIQIVTSTGNPYFDQAAIKTLRQWKSAPSNGWQATVPVTFRTR